MSSLRLGIATVALLGMMAASATSPPRPVMKHLAQTPGSAPLRAFGGRGAAQLASGVGGKLDAALADLSRYASRVRADHALEDLHSLSPAARFMQHAPGAEPLVAVDAVTRGDPQLLKDALVALGLEHPSVFRNDVGGWLPLSSIEAAAVRPELASLRAALSRTRAAVATQGDFAQGTASLRSAEPGLNGSGVTVGILSVSFDCYSFYAANQGKSFGSPAVPDPPAAGTTGYAPFGFTADAAMDVSTGALPAGVKVLEEAGGGGAGCVTAFGYPLQLPFTDEGRAMLQIVHAVAPSASLAFYTADNSEADFANGIQALANAGAKVIADDVGYFDEPFFQDGLLAQAIDTVAGQGVAYFSAAGNDSNLAYDNTAPQFTLGGGPTGEMLLNFDASGKTNAPALTVNVPPLFPGEFIAVVLQWDQPFLTGAYPGNASSSAGATSALDLCVTGAGGNEVLDYNDITKQVACTGPNALGTDPVQILIVANPASAAGNTAKTIVSISVGLANGSPAPGRIKLAWEDDGAGSTIAAPFAPTTNGTIQGHPNAAGAAAVGAALFFQTPLCGPTPASLESFSSFGGTPILFDTNGNRLANAQMRQKPDFVAPDGVNTTFFGFTLALAGIVDPSTVAGCANAANYPNYFGTSAAAPHAAGLAALMLQANSTLTPAQIISAMQKSAAPMDNPSPDVLRGYGFLQAQAAMAQLPAGPPAISVSPSTITIGQSATLSWTSLNTASCNSSWGGSVATSGSTTVTPAAMGSDTYTLTCTNPLGAAANSATLTVNAAPPSGGKGGGGALGGLTLLALAGAGLRRTLRAGRALRPPLMSGNSAAHRA